MLTNSERRMLDNLIGIALLDDGLHQRLLHERNST